MFMILVARGLDKLLLPVELRVSATLESLQPKRQHVIHARFFRLRARMVDMFPIIPNEPTINTPTPM